MKKILGMALGMALLCGFTGKTTSVGAQFASLSEEEFANVSTVQAENGDLQLHAKAAYLMEYGSKSTVYAKNELVHLPIASMCKIMTLLLSFEGIDEGVLRLDEEIRISERAASMGGSQVFLEANASYSVKELLKSIVVCSANDSCVAMAERLAGSESLFVEKMNARAKELSKRYSFCKLYGIA